MSDVQKHLHILAIGQSNLANHGDTKSQTELGSVLFGGKSFPMADPILGGTGKKGSIWPRFCEQLYVSENRTRLLLSLQAQGGTSVKDWADGGKCNLILMDTLLGLLSATHPVNLIVWHQGERDTFLKTSKSDYVEAFKSLYYCVQNHLPDARWLVCRASYRMGVTSGAVIDAQNEVITTLPNCAPGPNTDEMDEVYRSDNTHMNDKGLERFSMELVKSYLEMRQP